MYAITDHISIIIYGSKVKSQALKLTKVKTLSMKLRINPSQMVT